MQEAKSVQLHTFFNPTSIAVVGASRNAQKLGHIVIMNLQQASFQGDIFPVNPHSDSIAGFKSYANISELPTTPDLAVIALPAQSVMTTLKSLQEKGVKNVIIFSAGFKEIGEAGAAREQELATFAQEHSMNILGPNCLGFANTKAKANVTFGNVSMQPGNLRFISQSGALATSMFDWASEVDLGFEYFITLGNKATLGENELLEYFLEQKNEHVFEIGESPYRPVGLYLESIEQGHGFIRIVGAISKQHPVFVLKPGKSKGAQKAMQSHTGALSGEAEVMSAAFTKAGIIECEAVEDFFDMAKSLAWERAPEGPRVAIVSNAGGPAVISTDAVEQYGLQLAELAPQTIELLQKTLPRAASFHNPVDVLGDALSDRYTVALKPLLADPNVDALVVILTPQVMTQIKETSEVISDLSKQFQKPIMCSFIGAGAIAEGEKILHKNKIPTFRYPERALRALSKMWRWRQWQQSREKIQPEIILPTISQQDITAISTLLTPAQRAGNAALDSIAANNIMQVLGLTTPKIQIVEGGRMDLPYTVVLKLSSASLLHKIDKQAVITNISNKNEFDVAVKKLTRVQTDIEQETNERVEMVAQQFIEHGIELLVSAHRDASFGIVATIGAGGTYTELFQDQVTLVQPFEKQDIAQALDTLRIGSILKGYRGQKAYAWQETEHVITTLIALLQQESDIQEIEINPLIVTTDKAWVVDAKVLL